MKKWYVVLILCLALTALLFFRINYTGFAVKETSDFFCNPPYYEYAQGSCCLDVDFNGVCDIDEKIVAEEIPEETSQVTETVEIPVTEPNIFYLKEGETAVFNNKEITVKNIEIFNVNVETTVEVNGMERIIHTTQYPEIINGLKITVLKLNNLEQSVTIKVEPFELKDKEYLLYVGKSIPIFNEIIRLRDIFDDGSVLIDFMNVDEGYKIKIKEGSSEEFRGLEITNVEAFPRAIKYERYAILKIEQI